MNQRIERLKQIDEAVHNSDLLFHGVSKHLLGVLYCTDSEMRITHISPTSLSLFGYLSNEMIGKHFRRFPFR